MAEHNRAGNQHGGSNPGPPRCRLPFMLGVEEMPDQTSDHQHQGQDHPSIFRREYRRVMAANHHKYHGKRQVIIVKRALLCPRAVLRDRLFTGNQLGDHLLLAGNDHHRDIRHHDGADGHAYLHKGAARRENLGIAPGEEDDEGKPGDNEAARVPPQRAAAQRVIGDPAASDATDAEGDRLPGLEVENLVVDHIKAGTGVIDDRQQREPRQPGGIGLPFEPCQFVWHARRRDQIFHHVVETTAMHLPGLAMGVVGQLLSRLQAKVERDEVERGSNPGNAGNNMKPAHHEFGPHPEIVDHSAPVSICLLSI